MFRALSKFRTNALWFLKEIRDVSTVQKVGYEMIINLKKII
jgi:hypothetical protein